MEYTVTITVQFEAASQEQAVVLAQQLSNLVVGDTVYAKEYEVVDADGVDL
jgi:hypothetical protein